MFDPLTTAAGVVGIAVPAPRGTRVLFDDIQKIADAPKAVVNLKEDLLSVDWRAESTSSTNQLLPRVRRRVI